MGFVFALFLSGRQTLTTSLDQFDSYQNVIEFECRWRHHNRSFRLHPPTDCCNVCYDCYKSCLQTWKPIFTISLSWNHDCGAGCPINRTPINSFEIIRLLIVCQIRLASKRWHSNWIGNVSSQGPLSKCHIQKSNERVCAGAWSAAELHTGPPLSWPLLQGSHQALIQPSPEHFWDALAAPWQGGQTLLFNSDQNNKWLYMALSQPSM